MKRKSLGFFALTAIIAALTLFVGCSSSNNSSDGITSTNTTAHLFSYTTRQPTSNPQVNNAFISWIASNTNVQSTDPRTITWPNGTVTTYSQIVGKISCENYYYGADGVRHEGIVDPFYETTKRQLNAVANAYPEPLNGDVTVQLDTLQKTFSFSDGNYLDDINEANVGLNPQDASIDVENGDIIRIQNANPNYRYLVRIYNIQNGEVYQNYWTSADVRSIVWTNMQSVENFIRNSTSAPVGGEVQFTIPGGILQPEADMAVRIMAFSPNSISTDGGGSFQSITWSLSELFWTIDAF